MFYFADRCRQVGKHRGGYRRLSGGVTGYSAPSKATQPTAAYTALKQPATTGITQPQTGYTPPKSTNVGAGLDRPANNKFGITAQPRKSASDILGNVGQSSTAVSGYTPTKSTVQNKQQNLVKSIENSRNNGILKSDSSLSGGTQATGYTRTGPVQPPTTVQDDFGNVGTLPQAYWKYSQNSGQGFTPPFSDAGKGDAAASQQPVYCSALDIGADFYSTLQRQTAKKLGI